MLVQRPPPVAMYRERRSAKRAGVTGRTARCGAAATAGRIALPVAQVPAQLRAQCPLQQPSPAGGPVRHHPTGPPAARSRPDAHPAVPVAVSSWAGPPTQEIGPTELTDSRSPHALCGAGFSLPSRACRCGRHPRQGLPAQIVTFSPDTYRLDEGHALEPELTLSHARTDDVKGFVATPDLRDEAGSGTDFAAGSGT